MGGRFYSLDQLYKKFRENDAFPSPKSNENQKQEQGLRRKLKTFFSRNQVKKKKEKKRSLLQFATIFVKKFVGSFSPGWLFFLCSYSAQLSMGGRVPPRPPYNLSTAYN